MQKPHAKIQLYTSVMRCRFGPTRVWAITLVTRISLGAVFVMEVQEVLEPSLLEQFLRKPNDKMFCKIEKI